MALSISPKKLDPLREIELLRQQQEQLQQLQQLEKRLKQTSSASSAASTASMSSSTNTSKAETATYSSWSQDGHRSQGTPVQQSSKTYSGFQNQGKSSLHSLRC